jgi:peroxiredoxin
VTGDLDTPIANAIAAAAPFSENSPVGEEIAYLREIGREGDPDSVRRGELFPNATLLTPAGTTTSVAAIRQGRPAVIIFFRGGWCPYCSLTLGVYRNRLREALTVRGVDLIAISPQTPEQTLLLQQTRDLDFSIVSDPGNKLARAIGILTHPADAVIQSYLTNGVDIAATNADGTAGLPMPTTVIINSDGLVEHVDVHPDYSARTEPKGIIHAVDHMLRQ